VAARGDVLALRRPIGFLAGAELDRFVVMQADRITLALETILVAPLDEALPVYAALPGAVPVSANEAGTKKRQVALVTQLTALPLDRFEPMTAGRLDRATQARLDGVLRLVLDLD
jgi:mRNA-degrading endonuclease toxin of MazEF toxin-antitoxin module